MGSFGVNLGGVVLVNVRFSDYRSEGEGPARFQVGEFGVIGGVCHVIVLIGHQPVGC